MCSSVKRSVIFLFSLAMSWAAYSQCTPSINATEMSLCSSGTGPSGQPINLYSTFGGSGFQWYKTTNGISNPISGATSSSMPVTQAGTYYVKAAVVNGCSSNMPSNSITITAAPSSSISPQGNTTVCNGSSVTLAVSSPQSGYTYQWRKDGAAIAGTSSTYPASVTGNYAVAFNTGCVSNTIAVNAITINTTLSPSGSVFKCPSNNVTLTAASGYSSYVWTNNSGTVVASGGSNSNTYVATVADSYKVQVFQQGCGATSSPTVLSSASPPLNGPPTAFTNTNVTYNISAGLTNYAWSIPGVLNTDYTIVSGSTSPSSNMVMLQWLTAGVKNVNVGYLGCPAITPTSIPTTVTIVKPNAPSALVATATSSTQINLAWTDNSNNETGFQIERSSNSDGTGFTILTTIAANVTAYTGSGLSANTTYYYRIAAVNGGGNSAYAPQATATTLIAPPVAPSALTATAISQTQINLTWTDNSTNETGFQIEQSATTGSGFVLITTTSANATSYAVTGLTANATYFYRVRTANAGGNSAYTSETTVTTLPTPPTAPTAFLATSTSPNQIILTWTDNATNENGFQIERSTTSGSGFALIATTLADAISYVDNGLTEGTTYYYRIRSANTGGTSNYTGQANATTLVSLPAVPSTLSATATLPTQVNLAWVDNSSNETGFQIERSTTSGSGFALLTTTAANITSYINTGLPDNVKYFYRIRAINAGGTSAYTSEANATTLAIPPVSPSAMTSVTVSATQINLTWTDNSSNETGFLIERSMTSGSGFTLVTTTAANTISYSDLGLTESTTYFYRVRAVNAYGYSSYTGESSATTSVNSPAPLAVTFASSNQVSITWVDNSTTETGYQIERSATTGSGFALINTTAANVTTYTDKGLTENTSYFYRVRAINASGLSNYTNELSTNTQTRLQDALSNLAFQYRYDARKRMIAKKVPGADWVYLVYDNRDRLVLTQDGEQRNGNKWTFTKYDELNRPIATGIKDTTATLTQAQMQGVVNDFYALAATTKPWRSYGERFVGVTTANAVHGYTSYSYPQVTTSSAVNPDNYLSITYYDNYSFRNDWPGTYAYSNDALSATVSNGATYTQPATENPFVVGQVTGSKVKVLDGGSTWLNSISYYDHKYRHVQAISDNIKGGTDRLSNLYDFMGKVLKTKTVHDFNTTPQTVARIFSYDHAGRPTKTWHSINGSTPVLLDSLQYNELGLIVTKKLHSEDNGSTFKQSVDYRYNIRGWLNSINDVASPEPTDLFSMNLNYNMPTSNGGIAQYNGNISEILWKGPDAKTNSYGYSYDPMNRLTEAKYYNAADGTKNGRFNEKIGLYDLNGNIKSLFRNGKIGEAGGVSVFGQMDNLAYSYNGNQLLKVDDSADLTKGFADGNLMGDDYAYDSKGNVIVDKNKGITAITYNNHLNLPDRATKTNGDYIRFIYDANGKKLSELVYTSASVPKKKIDYVGEFYYENDTLKHISHEEGRVVMTGTSPEYQYALKDIWNNVRVTFTTKSEIESPTATMETAHAASEQGKFLYYNEAVTVNTTIFDHTNQGTTYYSTRLNGSANERTGLARSLSVMPGDVVKTEVYAKYLDTNPTHWTAVLNNLITSILNGTAPAGTFVDGGLPGSTGGGTVPYGGLLNKSSETGSAPKAYLNYLIFDRDYNFLNGGFVRMTEAAREYGQIGGHEKLAAEFTITQPGYVYIYLSNDNAALGGPQIEVYFDDLNVEQAKSPVISMDDYYPFGLTFNSHRREGSVENKIKFQGQERITDLGLGWDAFKYRNYMADLGRFFNIDPLAEKYVYNSTYAFAENKLGMGIELEGLEIQPFNPQTTHPFRVMAECMRQYFDAVLSFFSFESKVYSKATRTAAESKVGNTSVSIKAETETSAFIKVGFSSVMDNNGNNVFAPGKIVNMGTETKVSEVTEAKTTVMIDGVPVNGSLAQKLNVVNQSIETKAEVSVGVSQGNVEAKAFVNVKNTVSNNGTSTNQFEAGVNVQVPIYKQDPQTTISVGFETKVVH